MPKRMIYAATILLIFNLGCQQHTQETAENETANGIPTSTLADVGINPVVISEIIDSITTGFYPNRHSLLIYKDHKLVLEKYFAGQDYNWGRDLGVVIHNDTVLHDMRSVSKSVLSACVGIAIDQGKIEGVEQKVFSFFPEYAEFNTNGREALTLKHLLTMTSGLDWNEEVPYNNPENSEIQMDQSDDPIKFVLSRKLTSTPGTVWKYNGGTTEVLANIIKRSTGKDVYAYAKEYIFTPLGITRSEWTCFPGTSTPAAASGLRLSSRDMLKFGILYMEDGKWMNQQIINPEWINQSLTSYIDRLYGDGGYGFQFWIFEADLEGKAFTWPTAVGNGDQRIFLDRKNNLLVVMTAGNYNQWDIEQDAHAILEKIYNAIPSNSN